MKRYFGMRSRLWLAAALPALLAIALLLLGFLARHHSAMGAALRDRAQATARQLAGAAEFPLFAGNLEQLQRLAIAVRAADAEVEGVLICAPDQRALAVAGRPSVRLPALGTEVESLVAGERLLVSVPVWASTLTVDDLYGDPLDAQAAARTGLLGHVVVEMNMAALGRQRRELLEWALLAAGGGLLCAGVLSVLIASSVTGPIARISRTVARLAGGDLSARAEPGRAGALEPLARGINEMAASLSGHQDELRRRVDEATEELRRQKEAAEHAARIDPLTGLFNRRAFTEAAEFEIRQAQRYDQPLALIVIDLDHFKAINDNLGHATGDAVLQAFARLIAQGVREVDLTARLGGEEFVLLLPSTGAAAAAQVAQRLCEAVAASPLPVEGRRLSYTASFGVAELDARQPRLDVLLERADAALYLAKRRGRNRVELAPPAADAGRPG
ncbi:MAG: hypothetical protein RJA36_147 [Pseudomonadota bacterium]